MFRDRTFYLDSSAVSRREPSETAGKTEEAIRLIQGEYLQIPSLQLTLEQIQRLWNLELSTTEDVVRELCDRRFLRRTAAGPYVRATRPAPPSGKLPDRAA